MRYKVIFPVLSALLLILTYPRFNFEFLAWVALIPLFYALEHKNLKHRFTTGYIFGLVFFAGILRWLVNVTIPGTIILILLLSLAPAIFCSLYAIRYTLYAVLFVPSAWVLTEYLRTHLFTGFPWALLGYSQSFNLPVIQIADITGPYGVSFLIVLVNLGIYLALRFVIPAKAVIPAEAGIHPRFRGDLNSRMSTGQVRSFRILFFILVLFVMVLTYGQNKIRLVYPARGLKVALIQGNIPQSMKWDPRYREFIIDKYITLTKEALREKPSLVIWPETSVPGYLEEEPDLKHEVTNLAKEGNVHFLAGTLREGKRGPDGRPGPVFNSATFISNDGEVLKSYDKIHLVPLGEFIPLERFVFWMRDIIDKPIGDFDRGKEFTVFDFNVRNAIFEPANISKTTEFYKFSTLICFEDIFPDLSRKFVKEGARFLVNITNDAWFGKTAAPYQHAQGSIFRAVENRVPVLRAANTGFTCVIDHRGKILKYVGKKGNETFVDGYIAETIRPGFIKTFYTRFGDVFSWTCIAFVLVGFALGANKKGAVSSVLAVFIALSLTACSAEEIHYKGKLKLALPFGKKYNYEDILVTRVIDGDTIELENRERVRLIGIDTPEAWYGHKLERDAKRTKQDYETIMRMGRAATDVTKALAEGKRVRLEFDIEKRDRYGRLLAYVYLPDGRMLNAELLKEGYAKVYTFPPNVKYVDMFLELQRSARELHLGLWKR